MKDQDVSVEEVARFERLRPQLKSLCNELKELARKKAHTAMSKFKVRLINEKLREANGILGSDGRPFKEGGVPFDVENAGATSDGVLKWHIIDVASHTATNSLEHPPGSQSPTGNNRHTSLV